MRIECYPGINRMGSAGALEFPRVISLKGKEIEPYLPQIIDLHLTVFKEPPYLYEGTREEYAPWMQIYADSKDGIACLLFDGKELVGAATGLPLKEMPGEWLKNFKGPLERIFYLGEEVILEKYRRKHLGAQLYDQFEKMIPPFFDTISFARIQEPIEPPLNFILRERGFLEHKDRDVELLWRDARSKEIVPHKLIYWTKQLA